MARFSDLKVYLVDDDPAVLDSLVLLLNPEEFTTHTFSSAQQFLDLCNPGAGGCLVLDIGMPGMNGLELQKHLLETESDISIVFITGNADVPKAVQALKNGAVDFIIKPFSYNKLIEAIRSGLKLSYDRLSQLQQQKRLSERLQLLTEREQQVMDKIVAGKANKIIAFELGISQRTVEAHRANLMQKMQVRSLAELVKINIDSLDHAST